MHVLSCSMAVASCLLTVPHPSRLSMTPRTAPINCYAMPEENEKYGHDPRDGLSRDAYAPSADWNAPPPGTVGQLTSINELQSALDAAEAAQQLVSLKFVRDSCKACASTAERYEDAAKEYGAAGQFYTVNFDVRCDACREPVVLRVCA